MAFTCPAGLTVMVKVIGVPAQEVLPLVLYGVTVMVPVIAVVLVFVAVKLIAVVPAAPSPMAGLLLVQE
jgi:hypothetical protein